MSYGLKYTIPFKTISEVTCEIQLSEKDFVGTPTELIAGATPIRIDRDTADVLTPIRSSSATIEVFGSDYLQDIYTSDPQGIQVKLIVDGAVKWLGYLTPDTFSQDFSSPKFIYEMEAVAALSTLKYKEFDLTDDFVTFREIIAQALVYAGYEFSYLTNSVRTATGPLHEIKIPSANFYDELGEAMTYYEVLEEIAEFTGCCFKPYGNDLYLLDYQAIKAGYNSYTKLNGLTASTVTLSDTKTVTGYKGTGAKLSRIAGKNKAVVNCSLYEIKNILPEFNDEGTSVFSAAPMQEATETLSKVDYKFLVRYYTHPGFTFFHYANPAGTGTEANGRPVLGNVGSCFVRTAKYEAGNPPSVLSMVDELQVRNHSSGFIYDDPVSLSNTSPVLRMESKGRIVAHKDIWFCINFQIKHTAEFYEKNMDGYDYKFDNDTTINQKASIRIGDYYYNGTSWTTSQSTFNIPIKYKKDEKRANVYKAVDNTNTFETGLGDITGFIFKAPDFILSGDCELTLFANPLSANIPVGGGNVFNAIYPYTYYKGITFTYSIPDESAIYGDWVDKDSKNDLIYENVIEGDYIEEAEEIDLKICTNPDGKLALSSAITGAAGSETFLTSLVTDVYGTGMAEHILLARVTDLYNSPRYVIDPTLANDAKPYTLYTEPHLNRTFAVAGGEEDVKMENCTYNLIEI